MFGGIWEVAHVSQADPGLSDLASARITAEPSCFWMLVFPVPSSCGSCDTAGGVWALPSSQLTLRKERET
eukprot:9415944-Pyramimonas_sp.AAC.1